MCCVLLYAMIIPHFNLDSSIVFGVELVSRLCRSTNRGVLRNRVCFSTVLYMYVPGRSRDGHNVYRLKSSHPIACESLLIKPACGGFLLHFTTTFGNQPVPTRGSLNYCPLRSSCVSPRSSKQREVDAVSRCMQQMRNTRTDQLLTLAMDRAMRSLLNK